MSPDPDQRSQLLDAARGWAGERLGPASARWLADPAAQAIALSRLRAGAELEDAVLAVVHQRAGSSRELANEFLAYFLDDLLATGRPAISSRLRSFLDTWDLAQSVLGDLWPKLAELSFDSRAQFVSLLAQRVAWKASNRARGLASDRRREDLRSDVPLDELDIVDRGPPPERVAGGREEHDRMILVLNRLAPRDAQLLAGWLRGDGVAAICERTGLTRAAADKALTRAKQRARRLLAGDDGPTGSTRGVD